MKRSNEKLWQKIKDDILEGSKGGLPGQWSARKAQLAVKIYKDKGGKYLNKKSSRNSLHQWTIQKWTTKSGLPSLVTGERYLPKKAIERLSSSEYAKTTRKKRQSILKHQQFSKQPLNIARKTRRYRKF
jgi:hypothetical protein